jgi:hypothetical protein
MVEELRILLSFVDDNELFEAPEIVAERILSFVEDLGMEPPFSKNAQEQFAKECGYKNFREAQLDHGYSIDDCGNDWDSEDDD